MTSKPLHLELKVHALLPGEDPTLVTPVNGVIGFGGNTYYNSGLSACEDPIHGGFLTGSGSGRAGGAPAPVDRHGNGPRQDGRKK